MSDAKPYVIVGAGMAGAKAAESLRQEGYEGPIVLLGEEPEAPYERPPLSKDYLRGESGREEARVHPEGFYAEHEIELRTGVAVSAVDTSAASVSAGGEQIPYDRLLLATGAKPRRLPVPGAELEGVHCLRDLGDADRLADGLGAAERAVVIGAGWIGSEVAASARQLGVEVTVVERAAVPLEHVLGPELGAIYAEIHRDHGVDLRLGAGLESFQGAGRVERVRLSGGEEVDCDLVLVGVGVQPRTALAEAAGLRLDDGIVVGPALQTSAPDVFAAGDAARALHPFYDRGVRVEHWANALRQGEAAGPAMLGKEPGEVRLPYFFSDQYDVGMEYTGLATEWDEVVFRGDPAEREFIAFWLRDGRLQAGMNVNVWDVADEIEALIRAGRPVEADRLRDPDVPLAEIAGAAGRR